MPSSENQVLLNLTLILKLNLIQLHGIQFKDLKLVLNLEFLDTTVLMKMKLWIISSEDWAKKEEPLQDTRLVKSFWWKMTPKSLPEQFSKLLTNLSQKMYQAISIKISIIHGIILTKITKDGLDMKKLIHSKDIYKEDWMNSLLLQVLFQTSHPEVKPIDSNTQQDQKIPQLDHGEAFSKILTLKKIGID